jgi:hypothetical protein
MQIEHEPWTPRYTVVAFREGRRMGETVATRHDPHIAEEIAWRYGVRGRPGFRREAFVFAQPHPGVSVLHSRVWITTTSPAGNTGSGPSGAP